ncbi:MAG: hypothetical protein AB7L84_07385 [Acidimicrobiia bacterium]
MIRMNRPTKLVAAGTLALLAHVALPSAASADSRAVRAESRPARAESGETRETCTSIMGIPICIVANDDDCRDWTDAETGAPKTNCVSEG